MNLSLKDIVKDNIVRFYYYRAGNLCYTVKVDNIDYAFHVPIEDVGDATFKNEDKAMLFMRYIRKALDENTFVKV